MKTVMKDTTFIGIIVFKISAFNYTLSSYNY